MSDQPLLFDDDEQRPRYPESAGFKVAGSTSEEAARTVDAGTLRADVLRHLREHGKATADEVADALGHSILGIRPRLSELRVMGRVRDSGERGINECSGKSAIRWEVV